MEATYSDDSRAQKPGSASGSQINRNWIHEGSQAEREAFDLSKKINIGLRSNNIDLRKTAVFSAAIAKSETDLADESSIKYSQSFRYLFFYPVVTSLLGAATIIRLPFSILHGRVLLSSIYMSILCALFAITYRSYCELMQVHSQMSSDCREQVATLHSTMLPFGFGGSRVRGAASPLAPCPDKRYWLVEVLGPSATASLLIFVVLGIISQGGLILASFGYFLMPVLTDTPGLSMIIEGRTGISEHKIDLLLRTIGLVIMSIAGVFLARVRIEKNRLMIISILSTMAFVIIALWAISISDHVSPVNPDWQSAHNGVSNWVEDRSPFALVESVQFATAGWFAVEFFPALALTSGRHQMTDEFKSPGATTFAKAPWKKFYRVASILILIGALIIYSVSLYLLGDRTSLLDEAVHVDASSMANKTLLRLVLGDSLRLGQSTLDWLVIAVSIIGSFSMTLCLIRLHALASELLSSIINEFSDCIPALGRLFKGHISPGRSSLFVSFGMLWVLLLGKFGSILTVVGLISLTNYILFNVMTFFAIRRSGSRKRSRRILLSRLQETFGEKCGYLLTAIAEIGSAKNTALISVVVCSALVFLISPIAGFVIPIHISLLNRYLSSALVTVKFRDSLIDKIRCKWLRSLLRIAHPNGLSSWRPVVLALPQVSLFETTVVLNDPDLAAMIKCLQHTLQVSIVATASNSEAHQFLSRVDDRVPSEAVACEHLKQTLRNFGIKCKHTMLQVRENIKLSEFIGYLALGGSPTSMVLTSYPVYANQEELEQAAVAMHRISVDCSRFNQNLVMIRSNDTIGPISMNSPSRHADSLPCGGALFTHSNIIDIWWWCGDIPLPLLLSKFFLKSPQFQHCDVRVFICVDKRISNDEYTMLQSRIPVALEDFGFNFIRDVTIICVDHFFLFPDELEKDGDFLFSPKPAYTSPSVVTSSVGVPVTKIHQEYDQDNQMTVSFDDVPPCDFLQQVIDENNHHISQPARLSLPAPPQLHDYSVSHDNPDIGFKQDGIYDSGIDSTSSSCLSDTDSSGSFNQITQKTSLMSSLPWAMQRQFSDPAPSLEMFMMAASNMNDLIKHYSSSSTLAITMIPARPTDSLSADGYLRFIDRFLSNMNRSIIVIGTSGCTDRDRD
eukprot:GHVH01005570.1.p1 GENE.GHVH01005570.1~~GHVH01005570.1.p1  ORF type:complete len:1132 (+),score=114.45 GHVH01005570.1:345-3740(+)